MRRSKPIAKRSKKTVAKYVLRRALVARLLEERPWCERCVYNNIFDRSIVDFGMKYVKQSTVIHEKLTRARGGDILDATNCVALCHACHSWAHLNPKLATEAGLLVSRFGQNQKEKSANSRQKS